MKKVTSTLTTLLLCLYVSAQVGSLETSTFNPSNGFVINNLSASQDDYGNSMAVQPADGKIVVAVVTTQNVFKIVRYMPDGTLDPDFGTSGIVSLYLTGTSDECQSYALGIQSSGKIVVGGYTWTNNNKDFVLARFNTDGTLDATFGSAGTPGKVITPVSTVTTSAGIDIIRSLAILPNNSIIAAGYAWNGTDNDFVVAKYSADGVLDGTFGTSGYTITNVNSSDMVNAVAVNNTTGSIYVAGTSNAGGTAGDATIACYTSGGTLDGSFNTTGILTFALSGNDEAFGVAIQSDNNILFTGKKSAALNTTDLFIARYNPDGTPDTNFGGTGIVTTSFTSGSNDEGWGIATQADGSIIVAGTTDGNGTYDFLLARYSSLGALDASFGPSTTGLSSPTLSAQADGGNAIKIYGTHIYVAGSANYATAGTKNFALAAFTNDFNTLPLVLSQFYAQKQTSKVVLQWQTASEEGVKQFVIERSSDGKTYTAIGQVAAAGTSSLTHNYYFADPSPFMSSNNYYRLLMQDADGNAKYSKILIVKFDGLISTNLLVYPSPAKDVLQIQLPDGMKGTISLQIFDMNGRVLKINNLASDGNALNTTMDVSSLLRGVYILKVQVGSTSVISRFTKQ